MTAPARKSDDEIEEAQFAKFLAYVEANYSPGVVLSSPKWHAAKWWSAARSALSRPAAPEAKCPTCGHTAEECGAPHYGTNCRDDFHYTRAGASEGEGEAWWPSVGDVVAWPHNRIEYIVGTVHPKLGGRYLDPIVGWRDWFGGEPKGDMCGGKFVRRATLDEMLAAGLPAATARPTPPPAEDGDDWGSHRDILGRRVREVWVAWAKRQPAPKPSWLVPYDDLSEADKEADRCIGAALWGDGFRDGTDSLARPTPPPCFTCRGSGRVTILHTDDHGFHDERCPECRPTPPPAEGVEAKRREFYARALKFVVAYKAYADAVGSGMPRKETTVVWADKEQHARCVDLLIAHDALLAAERAERETGGGGE